MPGLPYRSHNNKTAYVFSGLLVRMLRKENGLSIAELAEMIGISSTALCRIEMCHAIPSWPTAVELSRVLKTPLDRFSVEIPKDGLDPGGYPRRQV